MKRALLTISAVTILGLFSLPAFAGQITLGNSPTTAPSLTFVADGAGNFTLSIGANLHGGAFDTFVSGESGLYSIASGSGFVGTATSGCTTASCTFNVSGPTLSFAYGTTATNGSYLTGNLSLVSLSQTPSGKTGVFNEALVVNLMVTGGSLQPQFTTGNGIVQLTLTFTSKNSLYSMPGKELAYVSTGSVQPALPEPASLALLGSGLVALGGISRFKIRLPRWRRAL